MLCKLKRISNFAFRPSIPDDEGALHAGRRHEAEVHGQHRQRLLAVQREVGRGLQTQESILQQRTSRL